MGINVNLYLGPFVEFAAPMALTRLDRCGKPETCPNQSAPGMFCCACGIILRSRFSDSLSPSVRVNDESESLVVLNVMGDVVETRDGQQCTMYRFVPNKRRDGEPKREMHLDDGNRDGCIPLDDCDPVGECAWFAKAYAPEIHAMAQASGLTPCIRWGLVKGCS